MHGQVARTRYLNDISNKVRQNFILFDLFSVVSDLLFHDRLLVLEAGSL